jgi:acid phosphatase family membrane protein YuiD
MMIRFVLSIFLTWAVVNILKPIVHWKKNRVFNRQTLARNGGMPSGHTSLVASLATALLLETGFSPLFITSLVLMFIVVYDAVKVRTVIEKQARVLNALLLANGKEADLEETVGHSMPEVLVSLVFSVVIPVAVYALL